MGVTVIKGKVIGQPRPRLTTVRGHAAAYPAKSGVEAQGRISKEYDEQDGEMHEGAVCVEIEVRRKLPESTPKKVSSEKDTKKPDVDNIAKLVMDALTGHAYMDDSQVTELHVIEHPRERIEEELLEVRVWKA